MKRDALPLVQLIDANGHLFVDWPRDNGQYCLGCGWAKTAPEGSLLCPDAESLAADAEAQRYVAEFMAVGA
ncbi:hypothetical protein ABZX93_14835 [Streptomyces sp. NPDC006632]|uniref:hypothetical protein n=1 Tax=Streptomyces sp. NPDC006632 TaxID=3157182 RepID=UPI0033B1E1DB